MGGGAWSSDHYRRETARRRTAGKKDFAHSDSVAAKPRDMRTAHKDLSPKGIKWRECCDSKEHPVTTPVTVLFDVTGSMRQVPEVLQKKLAGIHGLFERENYVAHAEFLFGAIGDATCDTVPLQVGQFESDIRMDEQLRNIYLEGGGGGGMHESYELALYFLARHTKLDCLDRDEKGFAFLIGDEKPYDRVKRGEVSKVFDETLQSDIPIEEIVAEVQAMYNLFYIMPAMSSYYGQSEVLDPWRNLLGQCVIELDDPKLVSETIGVTIARATGVDLALAEEHLVAAGSSKKDARVVSTALAGYAGSITTTKAGTVSATLPKPNKGASKGKKKL